jgi:dTDP-4-dehydrorhamnose 3,5-epimerase
MRVLETDLPGVLLVEPEAHADARGWFLEAWNRDRYAEAGIDAAFVQSNVSRSTRGVLRGLHYQWPNPQGKLMQVLEGEVWDVVVDIRRGSPTFGRWTAAILSAENRRQLWVPEGFAHGFVALSGHALLTYMCTAPYDRGCDRGIRWDDAALAIDWPVAEPVLSRKDAQAPFLSEVPPGQLPDFSP